MDTPKQKPILIESEEQKEYARLLIELSRARAENSTEDIEKSSNALNKISISHLSEQEKNMVLNAKLVHENEYEPLDSGIYSLRDVLLLILYAERDRPIYGRVLLVKQVFLTIKEVLGSKSVENPKFVPYHLGPYSFQLIHTLSNMVYDNLVLVSGKKNAASEKFWLSEQGKLLAEKKFLQLSDELQTKLIDRRRGWDQSHRKGILAYVYNKYPEFTTKSMVADNYKSITWGRGRG